MEPRIVIVDDNDSILELMKDALLSAGYRNVAAYEHPVAVFEKIEQGDGIDILITDYEMPFLNGVQLLDRVKTVIPNVQGVVVTGHNELTDVRYPVIFKGQGFPSTLIEYVKTLTVKIKQ